MVDQARESTYLEHFPRDTRPDLGTDALVIDLRDGALVDLRAGDVTIEAPGRTFARADEGLLGAPRWQLGIKRVVDIAASVFLLLALAPVFLLAAVAVKLTSRGPLFYVQDRVGKDGRVFHLAKFRSMRDGAHMEIDDLRHLNQLDGPVFKIKDDPRITPAGRFMRKYSIDELPQLVHVLTGKMSLVGPRPPLPAEVATYNEWHRQRLLVKPGVTCIWQVSGRSDLDFQTWVSLDVEYIRTWRPWLDFVILLRTVPAVITAKGAY